MNRAITVLMLIGILASGAIRAEAQLQLVPFVTSGLDRPVEMVQDPTNAGVQYVVQQGGLIKVIQDGVVLDQPFLDLTGAVRFDQMEEGLLGLVFAPDYATSGRLFVYFSADQGEGDSVLARFTRSAANPLMADPASRFDLEWSPGQRYIPQPSPNHKGGRMQFGPIDGYLYIGLGDGGPPDGDPDNHAQTPMLLLGKMLRIDVNVPDSDTKGYRIPPDNPFVDGDPIEALGEIWDFGLRNPWRWSFDDPTRGGTGALILGDVGQTAFEEIDYEPAGHGGRNYGWALREGAHDYQLPPGPGAFTPLTDPIYDYGRGVGGTVIGGTVYHGVALGAAYQGRYFFVDYLSKHLFSFPLTIDPATGEAAPVAESQVTDHTGQIGGVAIVGHVTSVDVDAAGELYLVRQDGVINKLTLLDMTTDTDGDGLPDAWEVRFGLDPQDAMGENGPNGDPDGDGVTNLQEFLNGTDPRGVTSLTRYFAEGSSSPFFETTIDLVNPGTLPASVLMHFLTSGGQVLDYFVAVPAQQHVTVRPSAVVSTPLDDFSTVIETDQEIVAERTMVWTPGERYGSHTETAVKAPATEWFLAEGATHGAFDLFYLLENPTATDAQVEIRYLLPNGQPPIVIDYTVSAHARRTIWVDNEPGLAATDVSAMIRSLNSIPIIVERAMYFSTEGVSFRGGHDSAGVTQPNAHWFFAEGATGSFFDTFLLLANPDQTRTAHVTVSYLLPDGTVVPVPHTIAPNSRATYNVQGEDPRLASTALSTVVDSDVPIVAERSMYWPKDWTEAHNSPGATETGVLWATAGGEEGGDFGAQTYVLIANTSSFAGTARVTVLRETQAPLTMEIPLAPNSRSNVPIGATPEFAAAVNSRFGVVIESLGDMPAQIVVERATYSNDASGNVWAAGAVTLATKLR
jgi:glucose/arabinose dehydrogenase